VEDLDDLPMTMMSRRGTWWRISTIFPAIIWHRPATILPFGTPLFAAWVQSLLQKTLQRPETR